MRGLCTYAALLPGPPTIPINFSICQVPVRYQYVLESSEEYRVKLWTQRDTSDLKWYPWSHLKLFLVTGKDETALITTNSDPRKKKKKKKKCLNSWILRGELVLWARSKVNHGQVLPQPQLILTCDTEATMRPLSWDLDDLPSFTAVEGDVSVVRKLSLSTSASSTAKQDRNAKQEEKDYSYVSSLLQLQHQSFCKADPGTKKWRGQRWGLKSSQSLALPPKASQPCCARMVGDLITVPRVQAWP